MRGGELNRYDRQAIDAAKAKYNISDLAAQWVAKPLQQAGHEMVGLCLFHEERSASMRLNDAKGIFHCFGCGASGDIVELVERHLGKTFPDALAYLGAAALPEVDPIHRAKLVEEDKRIRLEAIADAKRFWSQSVPVRRGDPVDTYLRARAIEIFAPPSIRFGTLPKRRNKETGVWMDPAPCMVCACTGADGNVVGVQRVYFRNDNPALGKASVKLSLGSVRGNGCWLGLPMGHVNIAEGPEDAFSVQQLMPERTCIASFGTAMMPFVSVPGIVREMTLCGQTDAPGRAAVRVAGEALVGRGFSVRESFPPDEYKDWNDLLRGVVK